jgi:hypothetical protein
MGRAEEIYERRAGVEHSLIHTLAYASLVVRCGLGIGLATGKCCAGRIGEQGGDVDHERIGDGVAVQTGEVDIEMPVDVRFFSLVRKRSQRKHN